MSNCQFTGIYTPYIKDFIALKRGLGFKYQAEEYILSRFDRFTVQKGEKVIGISRELASDWCKKNENESDSYRQHRVICLCQLSSYLSQLGIRSYVPQIPVFRYTFTPYIYSKNEISALFEAADQLRAKKNGMKTIMFSIPVLLRFLYATGVRINEALSLKIDDINLDDNYFILKDSKNGKERMLPISKSLTAVCKEYLSHRNKIPLYRPNDHFFISCNGCSINKDSFYKRFRTVLEKAGINHTGDRKGPTVHSFRHTFSVHALAMMVESGMDLYYSLPVLSTYLGHQSLHATNAYVRLTAEIYPELLKEVDVICLNVFPKIDSYENY
jgi:integrase